MRTLSLERLSDSHKSHYQAVAEPPFELRSAGFPSLHCSSHYMLMPFSVSHLMSWLEGDCLVQTSHFTPKGAVSEGRSDWPGGAQCPGLSRLRLLSFAREDYCSCPMAQMRPNTCIWILSLLLPITMMFSHLWIHLILMPHPVSQVF